MRVVILKDFVKKNFPATPVMDYAIEVEKITTSKVYRVSYLFLVLCIFCLEYRKICIVKRKFEKALNFDDQNLILSILSTNICCSLISLTELNHAAFLTPMPYVNFYELLF